MLLTRRFVLMTASVLMSVGALTGLSAAPASADIAPPFTCPNGDFCLYQNIYYNQNGGSHWYFSYNAYPHDVWIYVGDGANDQATSIINDRVYPSAFAKNRTQITVNSSDDIRGDGGNAGSIEGQGDLSAFEWPDFSKMNDSISAIRLESSDYTVGFEDF